MRRAIKPALIALLIVITGVLVRGSVPIPAIGNWLSAGSMTEARSSAASALLLDGRILITGGDNGSGPVATAEVFDTTGAFVAAPPMNMARSGHSATVLADGRVLVAGGSTGSAATNAAEMFDPVANAWTTVAGGMIQARSNHTASLLADGRVLFAGGDNAGAPVAVLEIFDPVSGSFSSVGVMSSPRMSFASAALSDGRVVFVGGSNGSTPLASTEIFDPLSNSISAGPALSTPRMAHSATTLLDGRVLVAGGTTAVTNADGSTTSSDVASAEIYDPATGNFAASASSLAAPRRDHAAFLLPNNNSVLIVGGTSAGADVATAEMFVPSAGTFAATGSPTAARQHATGTALSQDGILFLAGGSNSTGTLTSAELYGFSTVKTDAADYAPGSIVTITGTGWQPGETVTLTLVESPLVDTHPVLTAVADSSGKIVNTDFSPDVHDVNIRFYLTAVGSGSGSQAQTTFTDSISLSSVIVGTQSGNVSAGTAGSATYSVCVNYSGNNSTIGFSVIPGLPSGVTAGFSATSILNPPKCPTTATTLTLTTSAAVPAVTYTFTVQATGGGTVTNTGTLDVHGLAAKYLVTSSNNSPVAGTQVTITAQLADSGSNAVPTPGKVVTWSSTNGGSFSSPTSTTNASGIATVTFTTSTVAGTVHTVTATDTTPLTGTSGNITTAVGPATQLAFLQQPTNTVAATTIAPAITVKEEDANGNVVTTDSATSIALAILNNPSAGTLSGTTSRKLTSGIATYNDLSINKT